jgi:hypothetical protein
MSGENTVVTSLQSALETELSFKPADHRFTAEELAMFDQLHTRGFAATVELAQALGILPDVHVLDIGAGRTGKISFGDIRVFRRRYRYESRDRRRSKLSFDALGWLGKSARIV